MPRNSGREIIDVKNLTKAQRKVKLKEVGWVMWRHSIHSWTLITMVKRTTRKTATMKEVSKFPERKPRYRTLKNELAMPGKPQVRFCRKAKDPSCTKSSSIRRMLRKNIQSGP